MADLIVNIIGFFLTGMGSVCLCPKSMRCQLFFVWLLTLGSVVLAELVASHHLPPLLGFALSLSSLFLACSYLGYIFWSRHRLSLGETRG